MLPNLDSFKQSSPEKIFIFFLFTFSTGGFLLFSPPESLLILMVISAIFFSGAVFVGFFIRNSFVALGFPFAFFLLTQSSDLSGEQFWASIFFGFSAMFVSLWISRELQNSISLRFFQTSSAGISKGLSFFFLGILSLMLAQTSVPDSIKTLMQNSSTVSTITEKFIDQSQDVQTSESLESALTAMMMQQLEPKINALCEGNTTCIATQKKAALDSISSRLANTDTQSLTTEQKADISKNIEATLQEKITDILDPKSLETFVQKNSPIEFFKNISGEALQKIILIFVIFLMILPFKFLFAWVFAFLNMLLFLLLLSLGIVRMNTKEVSKEILY